MIKMRTLLLCLLCLPYLAACQSKELNEFHLNDFYSQNADLDKRVNEIYNKLNNEQRAAQMIVAAAGRYGRDEATVKKLVENENIGGVLLLNGTKEGFTTLVKDLNEMNPGLGMIYSADAEPSLINRKIQGTTEVKKTSELADIDDCRKTAAVISNDLLNIGIQHNYAPVIDISQENEAIGNRSFGSDPLRVINMAMAFVEESQKMNIATTVKHFPGHGNVKGDTHKKLVFIDGEMTELANYKPFIDAGVLSIMVAHLAVENNSKYNTDGQPATCSKSIVTDLLRKEMGFKGIIVTDALNMGAVNTFENAPFKAVQAGCDLILMPPNEEKLQKEIAKALTEKSALQNQIRDSVKRVIRMKLCLGVI